MSVVLSVVESRTNSYPPGEFEAISNDEYVVVQVQMKYSILPRMIVRWWERTDAIELGASEHSAGQRDPGPR